ncbi:MAG: BREX protein BrxB domain-containing protein [Prochlorococcaceae cyanobacterium]
MSRIDDLAARYADHIRTPWQQGLPAANRVVMLVYEKEAERQLRGKLGEFEQLTKGAGHGWHLVDLTTAFADWMASMKYREDYFERPDDIRLKLDTGFLRYVAELIKVQLSQATDNDVVALLGAGSLFGFLRLSDVIREIEGFRTADQEPLLQGRLVVFFPGQKDGNNYRLLDARDGWNYMAVGITRHPTGAVA